MMDLRRGHSSIIVFMPSLRRNSYTRGYSWMRNGINRSLRLSHAWYRVIIRNFSSYKCPSARNYSSVANNSIDRFDRCICISREAFALDLVLSRAKWIPVFPDDGERMPFLSSSTAMPFLLGFIRTWGKIIFPIDDERKRIVRRMQRFFIFL